MKERILLIDNHDSFTYNLLQILEEHGKFSIDVIKNDKLILKSIDVYKKILISPGPGVPSEIKILKKVINNFFKTKSMLGVCLGHQAIAEAFGGKLYNLNSVVHGISKKMIITDSNDYLFKGLPSTFEAGLYHSWAVLPSSLPDCISISAISDDEIVMAISHKNYDVKGIQFHPESIITKVGKKILFNWLNH